MESYLMMLYVTLEQETALKTFFIAQGWAFQKPDLSVTTDKLGPVIKPSAEAYAPSQAETLIVPDPENTPGSSDKSKPRPLGKRNYKSSFAKEPFAKVPRIQDQPACSSGSFNPTQESENITERSDNVVIITADDQTDVVAFEPVPFDDGNSAIIKKEYVDTEYEHGNNAGMGNDSIGPDERHDYNLSAGSADQDVFMCLSTTEGELGRTEQKDITAEQSKQPKVSTVNKKKRNYKSSYSPEALLQAYEEDKKGTPVKTCARMYGVLAMILSDRIKGKVDPNNCMPGPNTVLSPSEEKILVEYVSMLATLGYHYNNTLLQFLGGELAFKYGHRDSSKRLSINWLYGFLTRWKDKLVLIKPNNQESCVAKTITPEQVRSYIHLNEIIKKYNLNQKPEKQIHLDDTHFKPSHPPKGHATAAPATCSKRKSTKSKVN